MISQNMIELSFLLIRAATMQSLSSRHQQHTVRFNFNLIILPSLGDLKKQTKNETNLFIRLDPGELFS